MPAKKAGKKSASKKSASSRATSKKGTDKKKSVKKHSAPIARQAKKAASRTATGATRSKIGRAHV